MKVNRWKQLTQSFSKHFDSVEEENGKIRAETSIYSIEIAESGLLKAEMPRHEIQANINEVFFEEEKVILEGENFRYEFRI